MRNRLVLLIGILLGIVSTNAQNYNEMIEDGTFSVSEICSFACPESLANACAQQKQCFQKCKTHRYYNHYDFNAFDIQNTASVRQNTGFIAPERKRHYKPFTFQPN